MKDSSEEVLIERLKVRLRGELNAEGHRDPDTGKWMINCSSILTRLIQEAGRWCQDYASDLFIHWKYQVDLKLEAGEMKTNSIIFAFRSSGVDTEKQYNCNKAIRGYYIAVWKLDVTVDMDSILFHLEKVD